MWPTAAAGVADAGATLASSLPAFAGRQSSAPTFDLPTPVGPAITTTSGLSAEAKSAPAAAADDPSSRVAAVPGQGRFGMMAEGFRNRPSAGEGECAGEKAVEEAK